ncbi:MAG: glutathione S-transferase C-terminal domain-containing protein [Deltaproteobacteria bacterium]|nr:glutathione S-transferase C-terminal domain-containing protein [Deltaproteobacteria bacterium]
MSQVYDGTVVSDDEAAHLASQLYQRLDHLERALDGHAFLVGDRFSIADISVLPRVAMYPMVQLPIEDGRYPNVSRWLTEVGERPAFAQSVIVPPARESPT